MQLFIISLKIFKSSEQKDGKYILVTNNKNNTYHILFENSIKIIASWDNIIFKDSTKMNLKFQKVNSIN